MKIFLLFNKPLPQIKANSMFSLYIKGQAGQWTFGHGIMYQTSPNIFHFYCLVNSIAISYHKYYEANTTIFPLNLEIDQCPP